VRERRGFRAWMQQEARVPADNRVRRRPGQIGAATPRAFVPGAPELAALESGAWEAGRPGCNRECAMCRSIRAIHASLADSRALARHLAHLAVIALTWRRGAALMATVLIVAAIVMICCWEKKGAGTPAARIKLCWEIRGRVPTRKAKQCRKEVGSV
jgi:hypothetical protein